MGLEIAMTRTRSGDPDSGRDTRRRRFGYYFPRLFAYVRPWMDGDRQARDVVADVFARVFANGIELDEDEFRVVLFGLARDVCHGGAGVRNRARAGLNGRERDVIALVFDAQLKRGEIGRLLGIDGNAVASTLVRGLKKLRAGHVAAVVSSTPSS